MTLPFTNSVRENRPPKTLERVKGREEILERSGRMIIGNFLFERIAASLKILDLVFM